MKFILNRVAAIAIGALAVWREVRNESHACKLAVAYVIVTRAKQPGRWGGSNVLDVVRAPNQFTSMTHPGDPQLTYFPKNGDPRFEDCLSVMTAAMSELEENPMPEADSYHDVSIETPKTEEWQSKRRLGQIDRIIFFRTP